jgi:hypothetical protein
VLDLVICALEVLQDIVQKAIDLFKKFTLLGDVKRANLLELDAERFAEHFFWLLVRNQRSGFAIAASALVRILLELVDSGSAS